MRSWFSQSGIAKQRIGIQRLFSLCFLSLQLIIQDLNHAPSGGYKQTLGYTQETEAHPQGFVNHPVSNWEYLLKPKLGPKKVTDIKNWGATPKRAAFSRVEGKANSYWVLFFEVFTYFILQSLELVSQQYKWASVFYRMMKDCPTLPLLGLYSLPSLLVMAEFWREEWDCVGFGLSQSEAKWGRSFPPILGKNISL